MKRRTAVKRNYHTIDKQGKVGERNLTEFLVRNGQALLPMMELIEQSRMALDVIGRASIEAVLQLSAVQMAGPPQQGEARLADLVWHGTQPGRVCLKERKLRVNKPRLRNKNTPLRAIIQNPDAAADFLRLDADSRGLPPNEFPY